jgi:hypothetical protein
MAMQPILLKKDEILKGDRGYVQLLGEVEAISIGNVELGSKGGKKRWEGKTDEEKKAFGQKLLEARMKKRSAPDPALIKAFNTLIPKVEVPIEGPELKPKPSKKSSDDGIDWSQGNFAIASANGLTVPQVQAMREKLLLKGELK